MNETSVYGEHLQVVLMVLCSGDRPLDTLGQHPWLLLRLACLQIAHHWSVITLTGSVYTCREILTTSQCFINNGSVALEQLMFNCCEIYPQALNHRISLIATHNQLNKIKLYLDLCVHMQLENLKISVYVHQFQQLIFSTWYNLLFQAYTTLCILAEGITSTWSINNFICYNTHIL